LGQTFEMTAGEQVREWLHVDDAVAALLAALSCDAGPGGAVANAGTGDGIALVELVRKVYATAGADPVLVRAGARPYRPGDPHRLVMNATRARGLLGWHAATPLDAGLAALIAGAKCV
jgi:UDP-glucose 4-epimerase